MEERQKYGRTDGHKDDEFNMPKMRCALFWDITNHKVQFLTHVSRQPIGPIFNGQEIKVFLEVLTTICRVTFQKSTDLIYIAAEAQNYS